MDKTKKKVGFFFSCYKEDDAVRFCLSNIREYYPDSPVYIASDGGSDFLDICDENSKFILYDDILGYVNNPETKDPEMLFVCCKEFLKRLEDALKYCETEYLVYYEPDILLRGNIFIDEEKDLCGSFANIIHTNVMELIRKYNPKNTNSNFGACGGSIIKTSSLSEILKNTSDDLLREIIYTDKRISNCDYLLTVLFCIFGYIYSENLDFVEAKRNHDWENSKHSIVHQYHKNYIENYNGKYKES